MSEKTYDVAIIGYGPTGATAANLLGQLGLDVLVVERDSDIYQRARAISTDEEVLRIWQAVGLADRLQRDMLPDRPVAFVDAHGVPFIETTITSRGSGHPPQQFLYQPAVDRVLRAGVARFPNVEVLLEHEAVQTVNGAEHVTLVLASADGSRTVRARYVIAADGGSSPTRGRLGVGYSGTTYAERWVVIDTKVHREWDAHDRLRFHCNPSRPTVDCPTPLGHHRWEFPARADEDTATLVSHDSVWKVLSEQGITEDHVDVLRAVVYSHHVRVADRWRVGRIFLAGDAAHAMPPWIGQGMSAGVRDVANLCWKIAAVLRGQISEPLLDSYEAERKPHVIEVTRRAVFVGRVITERRPMIAALRNHSLRALTKLPGVLAGGQKLYWIPDARYREGFFVRTGRRSYRNRQSAAGWQIPQPRVVDRITGATVRLDQILAGRWILLHLGDPPVGAAAWSTIGVPILQIGGEIGDHDGTLTAWLRGKNAAALVIRPDGFVYAAAASGRPLPPPPCQVTDPIRMLTRDGVRT
ncbi:bifunctional 3-(3-hydroxy-phenyl)propionate/3-hydroxycinnamic acid hydroxylase [[Mycobacterium] kokjensenii]|uniref:Bifunctional 3-(3-hydroxy-phenyl)propionate/3-hydroxycinnamic acid hydroxylase n=1 Tax=[Mycobacterium] kokjensenii TaxID=3064287 RepID=A0ABN9N2Y0_9MYCO|nr:bifunctional 3-(3-hydroxy-phenyl)propionate/3-hydroxycinnamic acid hydroxylase [Mycolicibacter sp. MU0083]CAJ1497820.1 bifunctional 3-(3-hydroxy-phenyl)propionate/3-hydroxycinnamic acid hydroxylase [Mycolicibacter sp. MU0083]